MKKLLCVSAHPDDCEVGCSATVRRMISEGWEAYLIVATNGENGFKIAEMPAQERIKVRRQEQEEAARFWGLKQVFYLDQRDGFLQYDENLRRQLVELIKQIQPQAIFTFDPANRSFDDLNLQHRDHRVIGEAVFDACFAARNLWMYPGEPHAVQNIYFFASHAPDHEIDISEWLDFKVELLSKHHSQFPDLQWLKRFVAEKINPEHEGRHWEKFRIISGQRAF